MTFYLMAPDGSGLKTDEEASQIVQLTTLDVEAMFPSLYEGSGNILLKRSCVTHIRVVCIHPIVSTDCFQKSIA
jgi:hypothetical protein